MPKKVTGAGLSETTIDNIKSALEFGFQVFRSLQGYHTCTIIRLTGRTGGNPILGHVAQKIYESVFEVEVEVSEFSVEERAASQGMIKMHDKMFEMRVPLVIDDFIAIMGEDPTYTIDDGGTPRDPDYNNIADCNEIGHPELHGIRIEDDPDNKNFVQYYRIYKVDIDDRMDEWIGHGRFVKSPTQDGEAMPGDETY